MKDGNAVHRSHILTPFVPGGAEAITAAEAAAIAHVSVSTIRNWVEYPGIGRKISPGLLRISLPALHMLLDGNYDALERYQRGQRDGVVADYFRRYVLENA